MARTRLCDAELQNPEAAFAPRATADNLRVACQPCQGPAFTPREQMRNTGGEADVPDWSALLLQGGAALGERQEIDAGCVKTCYQRFGLWHVAQSPAENQLDGVFGGGVNEWIDLSGHLDHDCPAHVFGIEPECGALICCELRV